MELSGPSGFLLAGLGLLVVLFLKVAGHLFSTWDTAILRRTGRSVWNHARPSVLFLFATALLVIGIGIGAIYGIVAGLAAPLYIVGGIGLFWAFAMPASWARKGK